MESPRSRDHSARPAAAHTDAPATLPHPAVALAAASASAADADTDAPAEVTRTTRRVPLTPEQQVLAARYLPMAKALAKPLKVAWPIDGEEYESAALLALVEAAQSYDPTRNVKFATFARYRIWGALRDVQRSLITAGFRSDLEHAPAISSLTYDAEENGLVLGSEPDLPVGTELESTEFVETWLRKLPARHAAACREIYLHGRNQVEAAEAIGCSKSRLSYLHKESLGMLNDAMAYRDRLEAQAEAKARARARRLGYGTCA